MRVIIIDKKRLGLRTAWMKTDVTNHIRLQTRYLWHQRMLCATFPQKLQHHSNNPNSAAAAVLQLCVLIIARPYHASNRPPSICQADFKPGQLLTTSFAVV
ncbi:hypothetical protein BDR07DRAFT_485333 [Suillus spraguei]|nr:hypothetical protein BDR07DRAFT_485333 [Suillus spraguei]